ncbi:putative quinol monooxygenase [Kitasatospora sp. NPDC088391]|uniref:putative quinol monooxygenase n=1 Tax=Kitasatospora sp. NPDC088391 TaxID=3364074 RepID=UPI00382A3CD0
MSSLVVAVLRARPEQADPLEAELRALAARTAEEPGALGYTVAREGERFLVLEEYRDDAAREAHFAAPYVRALLARFPALLAGEAQVETGARLTAFRR